MAADDTYAPKSPDLSSYYSAGPTQPAPQLSQFGSQDKNYPHSAYKAEPQAYAYAPSYPPQPAHINYQPHYQQQEAPALGHIVQPRIFDSEHYPPYLPPAEHQYLPPNPAQNLPPPVDYGYREQFYQQQQPYGAPYRDDTRHHSASSYSEPYAPPIVGSSSSASNQTPETFVADMPPRRAPPPPAPEIEPSPVKTKFPTARIKRIMQADEEVGKVAQQTPIAVGKALELFMIQLVTKSAEVAQTKGSKRVTAPMLKQVVETDEQWDFLRDIVSRVENEKEGSKAKAKAESSSDEEIPEPKKRTRGGGRKKKT